MIGSFFKGASWPVRTRALVLALVFFPAFALYVAMLSPTITRGGDCGELTTASYLLGIGHPTGYPVWCQLARLFAFLPLGEVAWRYGLFDALCGALAAGVLAVVAHRVLSPCELSPCENKNERAPEPNAGRDANAGHERFCALWGALGGGWMLAGFWFVASQSIISEVYALAGLEGATILYFLVAWRQSGDWRNAYSLVFAAGSVFVVHLSGIFFLPFVFLAAIWKRRFTRGRVLVCAAFFGVALLPWLYLPIRSSVFPPPPSTDLNSYFVWPLDWSHPASAGNFKNHVTAAQYRSLLWKTSVVGGHEHLGLAQPPSELPRRAAELIQVVSLQWLWATPLVLLGAFASFRRGNRVIAWALLGSLSLNLAVELNYNVSDQTNFFFPAYFVMGLWLALGWHRLGLWLRRFPLLLPVMIAMTVAVQWWLLSSTSLAGRTRVGDLSRLQATTLQRLGGPDRPTQFLAHQDDTLWPFWYAQHVLGLAPDVVTPWGRALRLGQGNDFVVRYVAQLKPRAPVVLAQWDEATDARFPLVMLDRPGTLCLASNRALPLPAIPVAAPAKPMARFARELLWKNANPKNDVPEILSASLAAFEVEFQCPRTIGARDEVAGYLEVLLAPSSKFGAGPKPNQGEESRGEGVNRQFSVVFERRRLVAPARAHSGAWLRARVPLWIEPALAGNDQTGVWTRVVLRIGEQSAWKKSDAISITSR